MPTYGYRCKNGHEFEVVQSISDLPLQRCPTCRSKVRRIFYPVGVVFKGPGFYKTDSRPAASESKPASVEKAKDGGEKKSDSKPKPDSKPSAQKEVA
jgi:putative FmdB family regulatory protein